MKTFTRTLKTAMPAMLLFASLSGVTTMSYADSTNPNAPVSMTDKWDKTFAESQKVDHRKVSFQNRYGITLVGDFYLPKDRGDCKLAAIAVSGPFGAVKSNPADCMRRRWRNKGLLPWRLIPLTRGKAAAIRETSPHRISIRKISARRWIS